MATIIFAVLGTLRNLVMSEVIARLESFATHGFIENSKSLIVDGTIEDKPLNLVERFMASDLKPEKKYTILGVEFTGQIILEKLAIAQDSQQGNTFPTVIAGCHRDSADMLWFALFGDSVELPYITSHNPLLDAINDNLQEGNHFAPTAQENVENCIALLASGEIDKPADYERKCHGTRHALLKQYKQAKLVRTWECSIDDVMKIKTPKALDLCLDSLDPKEEVAKTLDGAGAKIVKTCTRKYKATLRDSLSDSNPLKHALTADLEGNEDELKRIAQALEKAIATNETNETNETIED